jgi:tetratricopeptide (TPR) repeat protein
MVKIANAMILKLTDRVVLRWAVLLLCGLPGLLHAETGKILVHVQDAQGKPVPGVEIGVNGRSDSNPTGSDGEVLLSVKADEGDWGVVQIVHSPPGKQYEIISPWDGRTQISPSKDGSGGDVLVMVGQRGDREQLTNRNAVRAFAEKINQANAPKTVGTRPGGDDPKANLERIAKQHGLAPEDLDAAIRQWSAKAKDPYDVGMGALYERNYAKTTASLQQSLQQREELTAAPKDICDAAFFLGRSLYAQGRYRESAGAYQKVLAFRPKDAAVSNDLALSLQRSGDYEGAEVLYRHALSITEKTSGSKHPSVATALNDLAGLLQDKRDYAGAEALFRRALQVDEKALGPEHPEVARDLSNLAELFQSERDYASAEPLFRRALAVDEKVFGSAHPAVATALNNLAVLLQLRGDYASAEPLYRRALAIHEKALGPEHPDVAKDLNNLAELLLVRGNYAGAQTLLHRALAIDQKALGTEDPTTLQIQKNLAALPTATLKKQ